jgi:hypothetical protein
MKALKPRPRPSAEEALQAVAKHAPSLPPMQLEMPDRPTTLNLRMRQSTVAALTAAAKARGMTMKQLVAAGIQSVGIEVAPADLEDRTPRRKDV